MLSRGILFGAAALLVVVSANPAPACEFGRKSAEIYQSIGLSPEQVTQLEALRAEVKKARDSADTKSEELRGRIDQELLKKGPNRKVITATAKQQGALRTKVTEARVDGLVKAKKVVSEEQFGKLVQMHWGCRCTVSDSASGTPASE
jgi:Spy/CpxP family protein refolding chaperone